MGWITKRNMRTGVHLAHGAKVGRRAGVLRKIVGIMIHHDMEYEKLECGHPGRLLSSVNRDMFSPTPADSRRCMKCREQLNNSK